VPSPTDAGEVKGINGVGVERETGVFGACEVEVVVARVVLVLVVDGRGEPVFDRPEAVA
jgi:hypothetical protein